MALAVTAMMLVRRIAPPEGYFTDSDRAAGVFGVLGTMFAVLLGFVIFVALESYSRASERAGREAIAITELHQSAAYFPPAERDELQNRLTCYARSVIDLDWPAMKDERESPVTQEWVYELGLAIGRVEPLGPQGTAYDEWFAQEGERRDGRRGRVAEASPFVPPPLWFVLILGACVVVVYMCFYADPREPAYVQAVAIGGITAMVSAGLIVVAFLDSPYENQSGSLQPVEMRRTLRLMDRDRERRQRVGVPPCDAQGRPTSL